MLKLRSLSIAAAVLAVLMILPAKADDDTKGLEGKPAKDFSLSTTVDNTTVKLSDQKGKVVVVDFWATWCPPCRKSLPHLQKVSADADMAKNGLVVWAVDAHEKQDTVVKFIKDNNFTFTVAMDADDAVMKDYEVHGIPTTVIVGRDGTVKTVFIGYGDDSAKEIDDAINKALAEAPPK